MTLSARSMFKTIHGLSRHLGVAASLSLLMIAQSQAAAPPPPKPVASPVAPAPSPVAINEEDIPVNLTVADRDAKPFTDLHEKTFEKIRARLTRAADNAKAGRLKSATELKELRKASEDLEKENATPPPVKPGESEAEISTAVNSVAAELETEKKAVRSVVAELKVDAKNVGPDGKLTDEAKKTATASSKVTRPTIQLPKLSAPDQPHKLPSKKVNTSIPRPSV